jgi:anoctamin-8
LATLLIARQVIGNIKEALLPFVMESYKLSPKIVSHKVSQGELEASMFRYDSTFDDYLELIIQFGYVLLFSSAFPLAAICALINNLIEIRSDAFKLCVVYQRPFAGDMVRNIGEWENVMNYLVYIAIIVNCALIAKTKLISQILPIQDDLHIVLISVLIEVNLFSNFFKFINI